MTVAEAMTVGAVDLEAVGMIVEAAAEDNLKIGPSCCPGNNINKTIFKVKSVFNIMQKYTVLGGGGCY